MVENSEQLQVAAHTRLLSGNKEQCISRAHFLLCVIWDPSTGNDAVHSDQVISTSLAESR